LQELQDRARDVQMLKFGMLIDLEKLERLGVNKLADELSEKAQKDEYRRIKEVAVFNKEIVRQQELLTVQTKENTVKLEKIVKLKQQKNFIENSLNEIQSTVVR
jgi:transcription elongation GreA/GreB family factor